MSPSVVSIYPTKVQAAIRMLGANFFQDMTGARRGRGKTYDQTTLVADSQDVDGSTTLNANSEEYVVDEDHFDALFQDSLQEGDEDAASPSFEHGSCTETQFSWLGAAC